MKSGVLSLVTAAILLWPAASLTASTNGDLGTLRGGMDSGGAGLYGTDMNPWFVENTSTVNYCIDIDPNAFHQSLDVVDKIITNAVTSWKKVLAASAYKDTVTVKPYGFLRVATQKFTRVPCEEGDSVDVRFQLGTLNEHQKNQLGNYRQWIGATYRTSYDAKNLKGRGFVYIAADAGPEKPISADLVPDVWQKCDGCLLQRTIVHELGHIFGVGHIGNDWDIMSERHLEKVTSKTWYDNHLTTAKDRKLFNARSALNGYLSFPEEYSAKDCTIFANNQNNRLRSIFDIPANIQCISFIRGNIVGVGHDQTIFGYNDQPSFTRYFVPDECKETGRSEVAWLYLPPEQTVFKFPENKPIPVKLHTAVAYERTICSGSVYEIYRKLPIAMSIITSRDGVFAGSALAPNAARPEIFSSSMD